MEGSTNIFPKVFIQTKSTEQLLAPIANQILELLLINESYECSGNAESIPDDLGKYAENVAEATQELSRATSKLANQSDKDTKEKMSVACDQLDLSCRNMVLAAWKLASNKTKRESRIAFVHHTKELVESLYKVMIAADSVEIRKIVRSALWIKDRITFLDSAQSLPELVPIFKQYTEALVFILNLLAKRQRDLRHHGQRQELGTAAIVLKKIAPIVSKAFQTSIKYPDNFQAKESKAQVVTQVLSSLDEITSIVQMTKPLSPESNHPAGKFVHTIDQILDYLKTDAKRQQIADVSFDAMVEAALEHSLAVAHMAPRHSEHRKLIVSSCQRVLKVKNIVATSCRNIKHSPDFKQLVQDYSDQCESLIREFHDLEKNVNVLLVDLIVSTFKETTEPLDRFIRAALKKSKKQPDYSWFSLRPYLDEFSNHADCMYQVASFVADSSSDSSCVERIKAIVAVLGRMDPDIEPAVLAVQKNPDDCGAVESLKLIRHQWTREVGQLCSAIDDISDVFIFMDVTEAMLQDYITRVENLMSHVPLDIHNFAEGIRAQLGLCKHLLVVLNVHLNPNKYHSERLMVDACTNLEKVMSGVNSAANRITAEPADGTAVAALHKRMDLLLKCVNIVRELRTDIHSINSSIEEDIQEMGHIDLLPGSEVDHDSPPSEGAKRWLSLESPFIHGVFNTVFPASKQGHLSAESNGTTDSLQLSIGNVSISTEMQVDISLNSALEQLMEASLSCDVTRVELLYTKLLSRANHIINISNAIMPFIRSPYDKSTIQDLVSLLCSLTIELPQKSRQIASKNINSLELLRLLALEWSRTMAMLESSCDKQLGHFQVISGKIAMARMMQNQQLLDAAENQMTAFQRELDSCVERCKENEAISWEIPEIINSAHATSQETYQQLIIKDGSSDLRRTEQEDSLERKCRQWASSCFLVMNHIALFTELYVKRLYILPQGIASPLSSYMQKTESLKRVCRVAVEGGLNEVAKVTTRSLMRQLEELQERMVALPSPPDDSLIFNSIKLKIISCIWGHTVSVLHKQLDEALESVSSPLYVMAYAAFQVKGAREETRESCLEQFRTVGRELKARIHQVCNLVLKAIEGSSVTTQKMAVSNVCVQLLSRSDTAIRLAEKMTESSAEALLAEYKEEQRQWAYYVLELRACLGGLDQCDKGMLRESMKLLDKIVSQPGRNCQASMDEPDLLKSGLLGEMTVLESIRKSLSCMEGGSSHPQSDAAAARTKSISNDHAQEQNHHQKPSQSIAIKGSKPDNPFLLAVKRFQGDLERWADEQNQVVKAARDMSVCLSNMSMYTKYHSGPISSRHQLFSVAEQVASYSNIIASFARIVAKYSLADKNFSQDLLYHCHQIPFYAGQLSMLTNVKRSTDEFDNTVSALSRTAENLMQSIMKCLKAAEAICVKGLRQPPDDAHEEQQMWSLATRWRGSLLRFRHNEANYAEINELGLRVVSRNYNGPQLTEILKC